jgi:hypothetical protein
MSQNQKTEGIYSSKSVKIDFDIYSSTYSDLSLTKGSYEKFAVYGNTLLANSLSCNHFIQPHGRSINIFENPHSFAIGQKNLEIANLKQTIVEMKRRLDLLEHHHKKSAINVRVVEIHDLPQKEIKKEVLEYYQSHDKAYPSDIADELGLSLEAVFNAVDELVEEGIIKPKNCD